MQICNKVNSHFQLTPINEFSSKIINLAGIAPKLLKINSKCFKCHLKSVLDEMCVEGL